MDKKKQTAKREVVGLGTGGGESKQLEKALLESVDAKYHALADYTSKLKDVTVLLNKAPNVKELFNIIVESFRLLTGSIAATCSIYNSQTQVLKAISLSIDPLIMNKVAAIFGPELFEMEMSVNTDMQEIMLKQTIVRMKDIHELSFGAIPQDISDLFMQSIGCNQIVACPLTDGIAITGTLVAYLPANLPIVSDDALMTFLYLARLAIERKQAEEGLKFSLSLLGASLESTADGILIVDKEGKILRWNQKFADMWKIPKEVLSTRSDEKAMNHVLTQLADPERFVSKVRKLYEQPAESSFDQIKLLDGRIFERYSQPQIIAGNIVGRVWSFRDITERRRAENQAVERTKELQAFYGLAELNTREGITLDTLYQEFADMLPKSWQYPEITCARLIIDNREFRTGNFTDSAWKQSALVKVHGSMVGRIDVCYLEGKPDLEEGPFLKEERLLIDALAERIGRITQRKQMEEALQVSEAKYRSLFDNAEIALFRSRISDGKLIEINERYARMAGYSNVDDCITEFKAADAYADPNARKEMLMVLQVKGSITDYETEITTRDGTRICVLISATVFPKQGFLEGSVVDITGPKQAEESLRESNAYLENLFNYANAPIIVWDTKFRITRFNRAFEKLIGRSATEVIGQSLEVLFPPDNVKSSMDLLRETQAGARLETIEIQIQQHQGQVRTLLWNSANVLGADGQILIATIAQGYDITERKQAEEELHRLAEVVRHSSELVNLATAEGKMIFINDAGARILGVDPDDIDQLDIM